MTDDWPQIRARLGKWCEHPTTMIQREGLAADIRAALQRVEELERAAARIASEAACERLRAEAAEAKLAKWEESFQREKAAAKGE